MTEILDRTATGVAQRFFEAITSADLEAVRAIYAPGARIWVNAGGEPQTVDENLRVLRWVTRNIRGYRYEDVRREATPSGFVQQHTLRGMNRKGAPVAIPACVICTVAGGQVTSLNEYVDSAHVALLFE
ncbi:MAG: nuclear transport factor 2 family protein [Chloroflexi bacterium]|nr:nuclear transport factor 2 family protein [Chloroflexota bacterium]